MIRKIIKIDENKCNGCGACALACHEGAIEMVKGKAKLTRENYCDGLGDCLPTCPKHAISFEEREAPAYDEVAVMAVKGMAKKKMSEESLSCGCPGSSSKSIVRENCGIGTVDESIVSKLCQWPVQIKLVPVDAPYFDGANLLIAADCTAYAHGDFHNEFIGDHVAIIGCPKLDDGDYVDKLFEIIKFNNIKSIQVVRMQVPCCSGIEYAARRALQFSGKSIPYGVTVISTDGRIVDRI